MDVTRIIPVVDFSACSSNETGEEVDLTNEGVKEIAKQIVEAFSSVGFVYLRSCGMKEDLLHEAFQRSREFFSLPLYVKANYRAKVDFEYQGYIGLEQEIFDPNAPGDLKEAFNFTLSTADAPIWPTEVAQFKKTMLRFFQECTRLTLQILKILAYGLGLDDPDFFVRCHNILTTKRPFCSSMRTLYYPQVTHKSLKSRQMRLGEHTDYGTITLVFQDNAGGLQVRVPGHGWIDARPIENTVLVNIADLLQRWTADRLISTEHRIVVPETEDEKAPARQSLVFFAHPDPEVEIKCIDGSNRYDPEFAGEYLKRRLQETTDFSY